MVARGCLQALFALFAIHRGSSVRLWIEKPYADLWNTLHQLAALLQDQMELKTFTDETAVHHNGPFMKAPAAAFFPLVLSFILSFFMNASRTWPFSRTQLRPALWVRLEVWRGLTLGAGTVHPGFAPEMPHSAIWSATMYSGRKKHNVPGGFEHMFE